jgi:chromosome segregation ATPase
VLQERWAVSQQEARVLADQLLLEQERRSQAEAAIHAAEQRTDEARRMTEQVRADTEARISQLEDLSQRAQEEAERRVQEAAQRLSAERAQSETHQQHLMRVIEQNHVETAAARKAFDEERLAWKNQEGALLKRLDAVHAQLAASELRVATTEERARLLETELVQARAALRELREHQLTSSRVIESLRAELALTQTQCADLRQRLSEAQSHSAAIPLVDPKQNHETG